MARTLLHVSGTWARRLPVLAALLAAGLLATNAQAAVPTTLTQQGRLLDASGTPENGTVTVIHAIYAAETGGTALWTETRQVTPVDGYFSVRLGEVTPFPAGLFDGSTRYLGMKVGPDPEMTPREVIVSAPYALVASDATGDIHPTSATVGGKLDVTGASTFAASASFAAGVQVTGTLAVSGAAGQRQTLIGDGGCGANYAAVSVQGSFATCSDYSLLGDGTNLFVNRPSGSMFFRKGNGDQVTLDANGNVGIGTGPISYWGPSLVVAGPLRAGVGNAGDCDIIVGDDICFYDEQNGTLSVRNVTGAAYAPVKASSFQQVSLSRTKKDIAALGSSDLDALLSTVESLPLYTFRYRDDPNQQVHTGVIAEQSPGSILSSSREAVDLYDYVGVSVGATKALAQRAAATDAKVSALSRENDRLRQENKDLADRLARLEKAVAALGKKD